MTNVSVTLYVLLVVLSALLLLEGYSLLRLRDSALRRRRKWMRIKVPSSKAITCRIVEPLKDASTKEYLVDDITMAGIAFYADRKFDRQIVKLSIKFPFTTYKDAASVWGRIVYSGRIANEEKYRVGISYMKRLTK